MIWQVQILATFLHLIQFFRRAGFEDPTYQPSLMRASVHLPKFVQFLARSGVSTTSINSTRVAVLPGASARQTSPKHLRGVMRQQPITSFFRQRTSTSTAAGAKGTDAADGSGKGSPSKQKNQEGQLAKQRGTSPRKAAANKKRQAELVKDGEPEAGTRRKRLRKKVDANAGESSPKVTINFEGLEDTPVKTPRSRSSKSPKRSTPKSKSKVKSNSKSPLASGVISGEDDDGDATDSGTVSSGSVEDPMDVDAASEGEGSDAVNGGKSQKRKKAKSTTKKKKGSTKVEGVGNGSVAAASLHNKFDVESITTWKAGEPVPYQFLTDAFERISGTTKRLEIAKHLTDTFRAIVARTPDDLLPAVYLCVNCVAPAHTGLELGVGDAILIKAIADAVGQTVRDVKKSYESKGDLGQVAVDTRTRQATLGTTRPLTLKGVFKAFENVAKAQGDKSQDRKKKFIMELLVKSKNNESGYIIRSLQGKLRIGLAEQTVLVSLGHAIHLEKDARTSLRELAEGLESASQAVKKAFSVCPSYDKIVPVLLEHGTANLHEHVGFVPGVPVRPMLAKPTNGISEVLDKFSDVEFTCEYKYDGERAQVHMLEDGSVRIYSRNAEDTTEKYPDIVEIVKGARCEGMTSAVLDAEAVAYDEKEGILPFQVLSTRARKDVAIEDIKVKVCVFCFDCLYLNGVTLLEKDLIERRKALYSAIQTEPGRIEFAKAETSKDVEELQAFLDKSVEQKTEGLIVKTLDATYEPSRRSVNWLKLKKDYLDGVGDTFDVVPIGAWHGKGKRAGAYGSYLLAVHDPDAEEFQTISKIGTGFSDEVLAQLASEMQGHRIEAPKQYYRYSDALVPEVWFEAKVVWEVKAADLSISPVHQAGKGLVDPSKGISIRFPRLIRVRDDKTPETATSAQQVAEMYQEQPLVKDKKA